MNDIEVIFDQSGYIHDRFFNESFELPNSFDQIRIQANELCTYRTVNDALSRLYSNFMYIYGLTKLSSNVVPLSFYGVFGGNSEWNTSTSEIDSLSNFDSIGLGQLDNPKYISLAHCGTQDSYITAVASTSAIQLLNVSSPTTFTVCNSTNTSDIDSQLVFKQIRGIKIVAPSYLFVLDTEVNNLYRYNIEDVITHATPNLPFSLDKVIGGIGSFQEKYKFNSPTSFCTYNNILYVLDAGNYTVKSYDIDLVFQKAFQLKNLLFNSSPIYIEADKTSGKFFIVTGTNQMLVFSDNTFTDYQIIDLSSIIGSDEFVSVFGSKSFNNVFYIVTNNNIIKLYTSKPHDIIGRFSLYRFNINNLTYLCADSIDADTNLDDIFIFGSTRQITKLVNLQDTDNFLSVLTLDNFDVFELSDIKVEGTEYVQPFVFNKAIAMVALNLLRLKDKIKGRFVGVYDVFGNPLLSGTQYFLLADLDLTAYQLDLQHFIGINEVMTTASINRGLELLFNIQQAIIDKSNTVILASVDYTNQTVNF